MLFQIYRNFVAKKTIKTENSIPTFFFFGKGGGWHSNLVEDLDVEGALAIIVDPDSGDTLMSVKI